MDVFTARAESWRSAMTRGQEVASAPRFPGEGNESFNAPVAAWRESMTRGQVPAASVADDHGGMTHKCDGCSDGAPCGSCGGNVSKTSPAYQALGWGMMQAKANQVADPFWRAATVAHALSTAPGRADSADWNAIESMVDRTQALYTVGTQGMNAAGALVGAWGGGGSTVAAKWDNKDKKNKNWTDDDKKLDEDNMPYIPTEIPFGGSVSCCPSLWYPLFLGDPEIGSLTVEDGKEGVFLSVDFTFLAKYKPSTEDNRCACECCEFIQLIIISKFDPVGGDPVVFRSRQEDLCDFLVFDEQTKKWHVEQHERNWKGPDRAPRPGESGFSITRSTKGVTWDGPYCYGGRGRPKPGKTRSRGGIAPPPELIPPNERKTPCRVFGRDTPRIFALKGTTTTWTWESRGIVYDVCHQIVKRESYISWDLLITVPENPEDPPYLSVANVKSGDIRLHTPKNPGGMSEDEPGSFPDSDPSDGK